MTPAALLSALAQHGVTVALLDDGARGPEQVLAAVEAKLADLEVRRQELEQTRRRLLVLSERCADGDDAGCTSLDA